MHTQRLDAQIQFARQLCDLHPDHAATWRPLIAHAEKNLNEAETILAPLSATAKRYTAHCVAHAHIDMNWMWSWPETVAITIDTFHTMLRLMEEFPDFKFSQSQASMYAIVERHHPEMLKRIAQRVKEGRWEVTASHWVECDKNMVSAESLCRHLLYTRQYFQRLFGLRPSDVTIDWAPDTFGHAATVPTYLARGGVKYLYLHRPGVHTPEKPGAFWWEGPDGARVLVRNDMAAGYNGAIWPGITDHLVKFVQLTGGTDCMSVYGVGDHGGGPTRRDLLRARDMDTWPIWPNIKFSTAHAFYRLLEKQSDRLPVLRGELNTEFTGCYTTETLIKKANRFAQARLVDAETACFFALALDRRPYPSELLLEAWKDTLFSHFHDILPGSGVHDTRTYAHGNFQEAMATTSTAEVDALRRLAKLVDTRSAGEAPASEDSGLGAGVGFQSADGSLPASEQSIGHGPRPFVIFNPTTGERSEIIEATIWDTKAQSFSVRAPDGQMLPAQVVKTGNYWSHDFTTLAFPVTVSGLGYGQYTVVETPAGPTTPAARQLGAVHHCSYAPPERSREGLENEFVRVELDPTTGGIRSLRDKRTGTELITSAPALEYAVERPHHMTAWSIDNTGPVEHPAVLAIRRSLAGPHKASLEVDLRIHESDFTLTYELRAGDPKLYIHLKGVWFQRGTPQTGIPTLRFAWPLTLREPKARYEIPFGAIDRDLNHGEELPALQWVQLTGAEAGCLFLNDTKHGHSLDGQTLRLTLIRSSYDPDILPEIGQHEVHVALLPFGKELPVPAAIHAGDAFNHPLRVIGTDIHAGKLPTRGQFVKLTPDTVVLCGLKKAEASNAMVARLFNPTARAVTAKLAFDLGPVARAEEIDLLERPSKESTAKVAGHTVSVAVPARGITSVLVKLARG